MIIKAVSFKNLKGRTDDVGLERATLIVGRNFTGKTTIPDAIKLALLGYHPSLDRTAKGIFVLASGDEMNVMVTTDDGATVGRAWKRSKTGSIAKQDYIPMGWPETPVVLLDAAAYFGATDRNRADLLFKAARNNFDVRKIQNELAGMGVPIKIQAPDAQEWIERALQHVEEVRSQAAAGAKRYQDTVQGLSALKAQAAVPLDEDVIEKLKTKRLELQAAEGKVADAKRMMDLHSKTHTPIENELSGLQRESEDYGRDIKSKEAEIAKANRFWDDLLRHDDCPMCGTKGETWRASALQKKAEADKALTTDLAGTQAAKKAVDIAIEAKKKLAAGRRQRIAEADRQRLDECEEVVAGLVEDVDALEKSLETYAQDQADRKRLEGAKAAHELCTTTEQVGKKAKAYLLEQKAKLAEALFGPILETAHIFTAGITLGPLAFEDGVLGMNRKLAGKSMFVPHGAFSGTEQAVVFAAFQAALAATAPIKLVIMDELGRIDRQNKSQLLTNVLAALEANVIDQFIGIDTEAPNQLGFAIVERT